MSLKLELKSYTQVAISSGFHQVALDHFPYIRKKGFYSTRGVDPLYCEIYRGDFHGLLMHLNENKDFNRIQTAFNGYLSSLDFDGLDTNISLINQEFLTELLGTYEVQSPR